MQTILYKPTGPCFDIQYSVEISTSNIHPFWSFLYSSSSALKIVPCTLAPPGSGQGPTSAAGKNGTVGVEIREEMRVANDTWCSEPFFYGQVYGTNVCFTPWYESSLKHLCQSDLKPPLKFDISTWVIVQITKEKKPLYRGRDVWPSGQTIWALTSDQHLSPKCVWVMNSAYPWLKKCANTRKYSAHICQSIVVASYSKDQLEMLQWHRQR